jgi:hypothetical protein
MFVPRGRDTSGCPAGDTVARFVEGVLSADDADAVRAHIDVCASCRRVVADVGAGGSGSSSLGAPPNAEDAETLAPGSMIAGK